jgi:hypothetical protein
MGESIKWLTKVLEVGRDQDEFAFKGDAGPRALAILASLQGARQMARIHGFGILDDVVLQIRQDLGMKS